MAVYWKSRARFLAAACGSVVSSGESILLAWSVGSPREYLPRTMGA
jgi:hypothetical protein